MAKDPKDENKIEDSGKNLKSEFTDSEPTPVEASPPDEASDLVADLEQPKSSVAPDMGETPNKVAPLEESVASDPTPSVPTTGGTSVPPQEIDYIGEFKRVFGTVFGAAQAKAQVAKNNHEIGNLNLRIGTLTYERKLLSNQETSELDSFFASREEHQKKLDELNASANPEASVSEKATLQKEKVTQSAKIKLLEPKISAAYRKLGACVTEVDDVEIAGLVSSRKVLLEQNTELSKQTGNLGEKIKTDRSFQIILGGAAGLFFLFLLLAVGMCGGDSSSSSSSSSSGDSSLKERCKKADKCAARCGKKHSNLDKIMKCANECPGKYGISQSGSECED